MAFSILGVLVLLGGVTTVVLLRAGVFETAADSEPMQIPAVGSCTDVEETSFPLHELLPVRDCTDPEATRKVTRAAIVTDTDIEVDCKDKEVLFITQGYNFGEYAVAHSCAQPNLVVGNCYTDAGGGYRYDATCRRDAAGRLDRKVPGVMDTQMCNTAAPDDYAAQISFIFVDHLHYVDEAERATYCFVPLG